MLTHCFEYRTAGKKSKTEKGSFTFEGVNLVFSFDGHVKLMGFQNSTFATIIYGRLDTASLLLGWIKVWHSNSSPYLIPRWSFDYLYEPKLLPNYVRLERETETGVLATTHAYLQRQQCVIDFADEA